MGLGHPVLLMSAGGATAEDALDRSLVNALCARQGVSVVYPFATASMQAALNRAPFPSSYLEAALDTFNADGVCDTSGSRTRDVSMGGRQGEGGNGITDLSTVMHIAARAPHALASLYTAASTRATPLGEIFVALVTVGFKDFLANFLCHANDIWNGTAHKGTNGRGEGREGDASIPLLVVTDSLAVTTLAHSANAAVFNYTDSDTDHNDAHQQTFGSVAYQELMLVISPYRARNTHKPFVPCPFTRAHTHTRTR